MANLGNTIVNGILRVNGKVNSSDVISAPSFVGEASKSKFLSRYTTRPTTADLVPSDSSEYGGLRHDVSSNAMTTNKPDSSDGHIITMFWDNSGRYDAQLATGNGSNYYLKLRQANNGTWGNWKSVAFTDSSITGNAATATKLETARTINGVSFDGSANITIADSTKLPLAGGIITGELSYKVNSIDAKLANNNVSSGILYPTTFHIRDKNSNTITRLESIVNSNGEIGTYWYINNYNTDGTRVAKKGIKNTMAKDGTLTYNKSDASKFRSAISAVNKAGDTLTGKIKIYNEDAPTGLQSAQLTIGSTSSAYNGSTGGGDVAIELWRGTYASWQILNNGGHLYFKNNYTSAVQSSYSQVALKMSYNTGDATFYGNVSPDTNNTGTLGTSSMKWNNVYATTFTGALSGNASSATKLATARTIGVSGVTGTAQSFNGTANIVIPITAVPATLLTNKSAIKGSEITNDKNWVPSSDASVTNFVSMTAEEYATNASSLATGTIVAITDGVEGYVSTQPTSLTCDLPLDL